MRIALFPNLIKPATLEIVEEIKHIFSEHNVELFVEATKSATLGLPPLEEIDPSSIDFQISLGGDGTILGLLHNYPLIKAPILGINLGGLGFMAEVPANEIKKALLNLLHKKYTIHERMVIEGSLGNRNHSFAVNEIVIHRAHIPSLIDLSISVNGAYLNTFSSDGLILSTPTGSTAYNLAAGGPILAPDLKAIVVTPICPHTISYRPIVLNADNKIEVTYQSDLPPVEISYDGMALHTIASGETLKIFLSKKLFRVVSFGGNELFFTALRSKLNWTGRLKY